MPEIQETLHCLEEIIVILDDMKAEAIARCAKGETGNTNISKSGWNDIINWLSSALENERKYKASFQNSLASKDIFKLKSAADNVWESFKYYSNMDLSWSIHINFLNEKASHYLKIFKWTTRIRYFDPTSTLQIEKDLGWR
jgi:hypothetical protein